MKFAVFLIASGHTGSCGRNDRLGLSSRDASPGLKETLRPAPPCPRLIPGDTRHRLFSGDTRPRTGACSRPCDGRHLSPAPPALASFPGTLARAPQAFAPDLVTPPSLASTPLPSPHYQGKRRRFRPSMARRNVFFRFFLQNGLDFLRGRGILNSCCCSGIAQSVE